jgi:hypothetical protein
MVRYQIDYARAAQLPDDHRLMFAARAAETALIAAIPSFCGNHINRPEACQIDAVGGSESAFEVEHTRVLEQRQPPCSCMLQNKNGFQRSAAGQRFGLFWVRCRPAGEPASGRPV